MNKYCFKEFVYLYKTLNYNSMKANLIQIFGMGIFFVVSVLDAKPQGNLS
jgi:hypothetical protein